MILKDAFRYQNTLGLLLDKAGTWLLSEENVTEIKEKHLRSKANPKDTDEEIVCEKPTEFNAKKMIRLYAALIEEKEKLSEAISKAKKDSKVDLDAAVSMNKVRQRAAEIMKALSVKKAREETTTGRGHLINQEGNQTPYIYDVKRVLTIDYDRNEVKRLSKELSKKSDDLSAKVDLMLLQQQVKFSPKFELDSSLEDAYDLVELDEKLSD